ncbi:type II toxin-antitoxin system VapC family toxin [Microbacterium sp. KR10-403]|uniref:type II toxin-antitoxin system VapC family toxin n=1 Tax=Microbacterium sp. KR10-403 TaxID=3158581 RepID=UPI0032E51E9A
MSPRGEDAVLVDAAVVLHALGAPGPRRTASRRYLMGLVRGRGRAYASTEMIQEVVHHRLRLGGDRQAAVADARDVMASMTILNFDREVLNLSLELIERTAIRGRDAVHAATALAYGIEKIASPDPAFDGIPGLVRIDPLGE